MLLPAELAPGLLKVTCGQSKEGLWSESQRPRWLRVPPTGLVLPMGTIISFMSCSRDKENQRTTFIPLLGQKR